MPESQQCECSCALGRLPRELRWMIFDLLPYSMGEIKMVSRSWRAMADDWIYSNNAKFFQVKLCEITENSANISFQFGEKEATCFPQLRDLFNDSTLEATREISSPGNCLRQVTFGMAYDRLEINRFFPLMKMKVRFTMINGDLKRNPATCLYDAAFELFTKLKAVNAFFCSIHNLDDFTADFVLRLTSVVKTKHFYSNSQIAVLSDPRRFLLELAARLESISITQRGFFTKSNKELLLFGTRDVNWVETFLEMFDRGICELHIDNTGTAHITAAEAAFIAEALAARGKPFKFQTSLLEMPIQPKGCNYGRVSEGFAAWRIQYSSEQ